ncbi:MAG: glycosyltransferase [Deltaproteobacteria bacterium]|nr:glycosyltransferase [Deltaproteobacteria bacterium]
MNESTPWLSVLIPTYNGEKYLPAALHSVYIQQDPNIECIIVDDGSSDTTPKIINDYSSKLNIQWLRIPKTGNWVKNTNFAFTHAQGKYICLLHQDDLWLENRLPELKKIISRFPHIDFFLHAAIYINEAGQKLGNLDCPLAKYPQTLLPQAMIEKLLIQNFIALPAPIFKRSLALAVGKLQEAFWYTADWDLWLKLARKTPALYYPKRLCAVRIHKKAQTSTRTDQFQDIQTQLLFVFYYHYALLEEKKNTKKNILKAGLFSIELNLWCFKFFHKKTTPPWHLFLQFIFLGSFALRQYLCSSKIIQRLIARRKLLTPLHLGIRNETNHEQIATPKPAQ